MSASVTFWPESAEDGASGPGACGVRGVAVVPASPGDHAAIHHFLTAIFQEPSRHEFRSSLQDPYYEPRDRVLLKQGPRIVGHAHVTHRVAQFGVAQVPVAGLLGLAVLPEFRLRGLGRRLLAAAEARMTHEGAAVGLLRTRIPYFFRPAGWALCGRHSYSQADPRAVLAVLGESPPRFGQKRCRLSIRPWRRLELGSLVRIYHQNLAGAFGPYERTSAYWEWLLARRAYDQLYVALDGPDRMDIEERNSPIVGYAFTRAERVVELMAAPGHGAAPPQLLARACGDAIERGRQALRLDAPPHSPLHAAFVSAGGVRRLTEAVQGEVFLAKLLDPVRLLEALAPELARRVAEARLPRLLDLGLAVDGRKLRLQVTRDGASASCGTIGRSYLRLNVADLTRLVLGQLEWPKAVAEGRLWASTQLAAEAGRALFAQVPWWRPPLDDLLAPDQPSG